MEPPTVRPVRVLLVELVTHWVLSVMRSRVCAVKAQGLSAAPGDAWCLECTASVSGTRQGADACAEAE